LARRINGYPEKFAINKRQAISLSSLKAYRTVICGDDYILIHPASHARQTKAGVCQFLLLISSTLRQQFSAIGPVTSMRVL
jgi:hypothetical protein